MKSIVKPSKVEGSIIAPTSKSIAQRAIAIATMANGQSTLTNVGSSDDVKVALGISKQLGANIIGNEHRLTIDGSLKQPTTPLFCGESGLCIRMFAGIASTFSSQVTLLGDGTLAARSMEDLENLYAQLGVRIGTNNGLQPITVQGPLLGGEVFLERLTGSQALTGALIASAFALYDTVIHINDLPSKQYIDLTIDTMQQFGVTVKRDGYHRFHIPGGLSYKPAHINIEGDWSGAAFMLVAGAIAGRVRIDNLQIKSKQPDRAIIDVLLWVGAKVSIREDSIEVAQNQLQAFDFDATDSPDLFPPLVVLAAYCHGQSKIMGISRLKAKESDRASALVEEFSKLGITITLHGDLMYIEGGTVNGGTVNAHDDHRIAMACAVAGLGANGNVIIEGSECVNKSYPEFFEHLQTLSKSEIKSI